MKFKKLLGGGLLATVLALGVGAGLAVRSENKEANAKTNTTIYVAVPNSKLSDGDVVKLQVNFKGNGDEWSSETDWGFMSKINDDPSYPDCSIYTLNFTDNYDGLGAMLIQIRTSTHAFIEQDQVFGNYDWHAASVYNGCITTYDTSASNTWTAYTPVATKYTVTLKAVDFVDGVAGAAYDLGTTQIIEGTTYSPDAPETKNMYHFDGWYSNDTCTTAYVAHAINAPETIYAKCVQMELDSYIFWTDKDSSDLSAGRVYYFGEYTNNWDEGPLLSSYEVSGGAFNLKGEGHLYKIPVPSIGNYQIVLHNGNVQTYNMTVSQHSIYYTNYNHESEGKYYYEYSAGNSAMAAAAGFLSDAEDLRNAATYKTLNYSVCGISKTDAAKLINRYDDVLDDEARGYVNASFTNTYDPSKSASESPSEVQVQYSLIIAKLREIADGTEPNLNTRSISLFGDIDNSTPIMLVVIISVVSLTAVGGYIFLKRRKEN